MEAVALHNFAATNPDELNFEKGKTLLVMNKGANDEDDWYQACCPEMSGNATGLVPKNYIKMKPHEWYMGRISRSDTEAHLSKPTYTDGAFCLRESESSPGDFSLSIKFRDKIQHFKILRDANGMFFLWVVKFRSINELIEYHKNASVSRTENILLKYQSGGAQKVKCKYDFKTEDEEEIPFVKGDVLELIEKTDSGWYKGKHTRTGKVGLFPANYVEEEK